MPTFREGTEDAGIWAAVHDCNEYRIPDRLDGQIVLDVGLHIGSFASLCKERGAIEIWGVEPYWENLQLAMRNFAESEGTGLLQPFHAAAWRSDCRGKRLAFGGFGVGETGNGWSIPLDDKHFEIPSIPFDDLVKSITDFGRRRLDWCKLDCEGTEWPILFTAKGLHSIDNLVGEYHAGAFKGFGPDQLVPGVDYTIDALKSLLETVGFDVEIEAPNWDWYGRFWAKRVRFGRPW